MEISEFLIPITMFICLAAIVKFLADNKTRRYAIEKELVNENLKYLYSDRLEAVLPSSLKWGVVLIFVGLAFLISHFVPDYFSDRLTAALVFILAGAGLIVYYVLATIMAKKQQSEDK